MLNQWHSAHSLCPPLALWRCRVPCSHTSLATLPHSCGENKAYTQSVVCDWVEKATRWKWSVPSSQLLGHTKSLSGPSQVRSDEQQAGRQAPGGLRNLSMDTHKWRKRCHLWKGKSRSILQGFQTILWIHSCGVLLLPTETHHTASKKAIVSKLDHLQKTGRRYATKATIKQYICCIPYKWNKTLLYLYLPGQQNPPCSTA